ncbi:hypothetical protein C8R45DRAFT_1084115 [Mycena sanguinolenta]|nr:hypothetical protein C8R45DRAFT_1084115 [Mycena sanguinolenta]
MSAPAAAGRSSAARMIMSEVRWVAWAGRAHHSCAVGLHQIHCMLRHPGNTPSMGHSEGNGEFTRIRIRLPALMRSPDHRSTAVERKKLRSFDASTYSTEATSTISVMLETISAGEDGHERNGPAHRTGKKLTQIGPERKNQENRHERSVQEAIDGSGNCRAQPPRFFVSHHVTMLFLLGSPDETVWESEEGYLVGHVTFAHFTLHDVIRPHIPAPSAAHDSESAEDTAPQKNCEHGWECERQNHDNEHAEINNRSSIMRSSTSSNLELRLCPVFLMHEPSLTAPLGIFCAAKILRLASLAGFLRSTANVAATPKSSRLRVELI